MPNIESRLRAMAQALKEQSQELLGLLEALPEGRPPVISRSRGGRGRSLSIRIDAWKEGNAWHVTVDDEFRAHTNVTAESHPGLFRLLEQANAACPRLEERESA